MTTDLGAPVDAHCEQRVRDSFARQALMKHLGASIGQVRRGLVSIHMPFSPLLTQQHGYFHSGASSAIADSAGGYAAFTLFPPKSSVLTVEFKVNLLKPAEGDALEAVGRVIRSGRTLTICQLEVLAEKDGAQTLVAIGQQTLICMQGREDGPTLR